ncbi:flagellar motor switch protein FliM [Spongisporangium articulatum]|uniref:Flagellar motor switch protein FliM n=1 Tax=Spongisporangium articulatum TaxID=3362603 RepID=A0ABW8AHP8_9ACTN
MGYSDQATEPAAGTGRTVGDVSVPGPRPDARSYDFRRPSRLTREDAHLLKVAFQTFGRQATTVLTTGLRALSHLSLQQVEEMSYDEYLSGIHEGAVCAVLSMEPLQGKAMFTTNQQAMLAMVDHLLGGPGGQNQPERPLSEIEHALVRHLFVRVLRELAYALEPIAQTSPELTTLENNAQFVQAAAPTDPVVVARMQLTVGDVSSATDLCFPYAMLAPALQLLAKTEDLTEKDRLRVAATARTSRRLNDVEVDVSVRFDTQRLHSSEIGRLKVGDVLTLGHRTTHPLSVMAASSVFALAVPGTSGKHLAALIVDGG